MSLREKFTTRLHSLQEDISAGVKQLSTQAAPTLGGVSAAVANAAAAAGVSGAAAGIVTGSPEYRGRSRVNLEAGGELLEAYQAQWERIHVANERNAKMATRDGRHDLHAMPGSQASAQRCDRMIADVNDRYERQYSDVMTLQMLVAQLPKINAQIEEIMGTLGDLESLFGDVEISLLGLEDTIDAREMQEKQLDQRFQVALYQERRKAEFNDLSDRLRNDYAKRKTEHELKVRMASREKQSVYQKKFENDVNRYNSSGNRKGSSEGSTPSGEAGLLKVPARHDPDASLETVDLNDEGAANLEAFLADSNDLYDVSPLPRDESARCSDSSDDGRKAKVDRNNSVDSTSEAENRLEAPGGGGGEMSRAESMYYTPDTTLEKLSEMANESSDT